VGPGVRRFFLPAILGLITGLAQPAMAMVPYVFLPPPKGLEEAGLGIAEEAVQMLRLGQPEYAARLAELTVRLEREGRMQIAQACFDFLPTRALLDLAGWPEADIFAHA